MLLCLACRGYRGSGGVCGLLLVGLWEVVLSVAWLWLYSVGWLSAVAGGVEDSWCCECVVGAGGGGTPWVRCRIVRLGIAGRAEAEAGWLRGVLGGRGCRGWCLRWEVVAVRLHWECRLCWQLRDVL